jgi:two-component system alkaline phosphatase synthesis response regulator PhoP
MSLSESDICLYKDRLLRGVKKILLAEDDPFLIDIYKNKLKSTGFELEVAETGSEVLRKLKERKFDLLLLDIVLPGISGWEILPKDTKKERVDILGLLN